MVRGQDVARVFVPAGQQIILKGLDQITTGTAPVDGIMKQMATDLTKEVQPIIQQVKAVEG